MGLPKVSVETYNSVAQSIDEEVSQRDFMIGYLEHLRETNPVVLSFIKHWTSDIPDKQFAETLLGLLTVYRLVESQQEAEELEKEIWEAQNR